MDLAIQGDGFFVYGKDAYRRYSREGSLSLDANGYLVNTASGLRAQGWQADTSGIVNTNLPTNDIQIQSNKTLARATSQVVLGGNLDSGTAVTTGTVDVTMGVYDSLGNPLPVTVQFTRTSDFDWDWAVTAPTGETETGSVTFDVNGQIVPGTNPAISIPGATGANPIDFEIDLHQLTMLSTGNSIAMSTQDGLAPGSVTDVVVTPNDGSVFLVYSNSLREQVGQLAVARFANPTGLMQAGHTTFQQGLNSGDAQIGTANTGGRGLVAAGYLEASNVDMAQEFTNMILAQRGFQASSRVITTSDEILQELVNLKR